MSTLRVAETGALAMPSDTLRFMFSQCVQLFEMARHLQEVNPVRAAAAFNQAIIHARALLINTTTLEQLEIAARSLRHHTWFPSSASTLPLSAHEQLVAVDVLARIATAHRDAMDLVTMYRWFFETLPRIDNIAEADALVYRHPILLDPTWSAHAAMGVMKWPDTFVDAEAMVGNIVHMATVARRVLPGHYAKYKSDLRKLALAGGPGRQILLRALKVSGSKSDYATASAEIGLSKK
jgi:hypothetical protein